MPESPTELRLCGRLEVRIAGSRVDGALRGGQVITVLAALALARPRALGRDALIDVLWPEELPGDAGAVLSTLLSRLRRALGPGVVAGRRDPSLNLESNARVDGEIARELVGAARSALAADAFGEERRCPEVALSLGVTEATARARVSRGLRALAAALEPQSLTEP